VNESNHDLVDSEFRIPIFETVRHLPCQPDAQSSILLVASFMGKPLSGILCALPGSHRR
jgi:hypothetical protein